MRLGKLRALDRLLRRDGGIEHRFLRVDVGIVGVVRRHGDRNAGDRNLDGRDGRLVLRLAVSDDRWAPCSRRCFAISESARRRLERDLALPRIETLRVGVQRAESKRVAGGSWLLRVSRQRMRRDGDATNDERLSWPEPFRKKSARLLLRSAMNALNPRSSRPRSVHSIGRAANGKMQSEASWR